MQIGVIRLVQFSDGRSYLINDSFGYSTAITHGLTTNQVVRLNCGGALVDRQNPRVAVVLGGAGFFDEAHTTVYLYAGRCNIHRHLGRPALHDRHHELVESQICFFSGLIRVVMRSVESRCCDIGQCTCGLGLRTHAHQHTTYIRMMNDGHRARRTGQITRLHAISRILRRLLVSAIS